MSSGMWTAVSGAMARAHDVDTIANNLANVDTLGFKKDQTTFQEYLAIRERDEGPKEVLRRPFTDADLHPLDARDQSHVAVKGTYTSFKPGSLRVTQNPLDLAFDGKGFLEVLTPQGVRFTKQGSLKVAADGKLVTSEGHAVLSGRKPGPLAPAPTEAGRGLATAATPGDDDPTARVINLRDRRGQLTVSEQGELYFGEDRVGQLSVVEFKDPQVLRKRGSALFEAGTLADAQISTGTIVRQGVLETSNVNPVEEMTKLIQANRDFEQNLKALKTYGDLMGREVNDIGKF